MSDDLIFEYLLNLMFHFSFLLVRHTIRTDVGWGCSLLQWNGMVNIMVRRECSGLLKDFRVLLQ